MHLLILASICNVAAGYLINAFYDSEKDSIHKPLRVRIYYFVGQALVFRLYLLLNLLALGFGAFVSWKILIFFLFYQIGIWLYSHKISKKTLWNNLVSTILSIVPFFVLFVRYKNYDLGIFIYASFLFLLLLIRDILKDLSTQKGDLIFNYSTLPLRYGEKNAKYVLSSLIVLFMLNALLLAFYVKEELMRFYFLSSVLLIGGSLVLLWNVCSEIYYKFILILYTVLIFLVCVVSV
ncbi:MAG: UbiA family prenyltransferase [Flavobacteriales bacterium Tduv]